MNYCISGASSSRTKFYADTSLKLALVCFIVENFAEERVNYTSWRDLSFTGGLIFASSG